MKVSLVILLTVASVVAKPQRRQAGQQWHPGCGTTIYTETVKRAASKKDPGLTPYVVGGQDAQPGEFPWMASLRSSGGPHYCAGVLIDRNWVLTAAHCVVPWIRAQTINGFQVMLGEHRLDKRDAPEKVYRVAGIIMNDYIPEDRFNHFHDMAMIKLTKAARINDYIRPVCAPPADESFENKTCTVSGWGATYEGGPLMNTLQYVDVPAISSDVCASIYTYRPEDSFQYFVCAGYPEGGKDACTGDSGGPLVYNNEGTFELVGISSWGSGCGLPGLPGGYMRVTKYLDWINYIRTTY